MISIIYTGEKRFPDIGLPNHEKIISKLREKYPVNIHWFTSDVINRQQSPWKHQPAGASGALQVWDFVDSSSKVSDDIVIRLRTDTYFASSAIDVVLKEIDLIVDGLQDMAFFGMEIIDDYAETYKKIKIADIPSTHIQDFAFAVRKSTMQDTDIIYNKILSRAEGKQVSGNKLFRDIIKDMSRAYTIRGQVYLIRKQPEQLTDVQIGFDFLNNYGKKTRFAVAHFRKLLT